MKIVTNAIVVFVLCITTTAGCTFRPYLRESRDAALTATPPCYAGDICALTFGSPGFEWTTDLMHSAR